MITQMIKSNWQKVLVKTCEEILPITQGNRTKLCQLIDNGIGLGQGHNQLIGVVFFRAVADVPPCHFFNLPVQLAVWKLLK